MFVDIFRLGYIFNIMTKYLMVDFAFILLSRESPHIVVSSMSGLRSGLCYMFEMMLCIFRLWRKFRNLALVF